MNLITKADDERLKVGGIGGTDPNYLLRDSLRVVIAERDAALQVALTKCPVCGSETAGSNESVINKQLFRVRADLTAALAQLAEKEGPLCAAREQLKVACKWLAGSDWGTIDFERAMHEINAVGYAPCRHEEEAKRLEDALVNLMKSSDVTWYTGKHAGHDWREAVDAAHLTLVKYGRRAGGKG